MDTFTELVKRLSVTLLGIGSLFSAAFSAEAAPERLPGKVVVAKVMGKVEGFDPANKASRSLKRNDVISENYTVNVGMDSTTTLVFSNGATISLLQNTSLVISEFLQDPFSTPYAMATATEEPTTSVTRLNLVAGELVSQVKKLRTHEGSSLIVNTPVGAAGVRGTTFSISYIPDSEAAKGTYSLSVTEGEVSLTDVNGTVTLVAAGREVAITVRLTVDPVTGETAVAEILSLEVQDIPAARLTAITQAVADGDEAAEAVVMGVAETNLVEAMGQALDSPPIVIEPPPTTNPNP